LTADERVKALAEFGFTERQARFLMTVMLFGGVCVPKQYAQFAGTAYGHKVNAFFDKLVQRGFATKCRCIHNRAALYHVHHRRLYMAIGEGCSRYRRPVPAGRAIDRVMRLDAVLRYLEVDWLVTEQEKIEFVSAVVPTLAAERLPHVTVGSRIRLFPDDVVIGVTAGRPLLLHLVLTPFDDDFRAVLQRYGDLLGALPRWTLRLLFPKHAARLMGRFQVAFRDELATPLSSATLDELRWYFEQARRAATSRTSLPRDRRCRRAQDAFAAPRFRVLYRRWLRDGEPAFDVISTDRIVDHLANETGRVECDALYVSHHHLSPLVSPAFDARGVEEQEVRVDERSARSQPPSASRSENVSELAARD
jgi:hypothetical protein